MNFRIMTTPHHSADSLASLAADVGRDWKSADRYYDAAEGDMERRWASLIWPVIQGCDFEVCVDLAAGHGRNTHQLLQQPDCKRVYCIDINEENIDFCRLRFDGEPRVVCLRNDGAAVDEVAAQSISLFYCFDAMVHFDSDIVRSYLGEIRRVLRPNTGRAFLHHSNYSGNPGGDVHKNPHWRNFMSAAMMTHYAAKEGLAVERQIPLDWNHDGSNIDCFTLLKLVG